MRTPALTGGLRRRMALVSGLLALVVAGGFTMLLIASVDQRSARDSVLRSRAELTSSDHLLTLLIDLETGQRGFVITREERFLEPWRQALVALPTGARRLARSAEDRGQARRAAAIARALTSYIRDYSMPLVQDARQGKESARSVASTEDGKRRVDALRDQFHEFRAAERRILRGHERRADAAGSRAIVIAAAGLAGSTFFVLAFGAYLSRRIAEPVGRTAAMARRLAAGDLGVRLPVTGPDEVGELEEAFNTMAGSLEASRAELTASRARVVAAADQSRRRIERDLHDGAQQRLVAVALELRDAEADVPPELHELRERLSSTSTAITEVLNELQEISRGIHPAILSEGGVGPALKTLARRSPVPVALDVQSSRRLPAQVELTAYFVASEALANVAKHANASTVQVRFEAEDSVARLSVSDDGVGGADPDSGSGLVGLTDRVEAVGGKIDVVSPAGQGTSIRAELPIVD